MSLVPTYVRAVDGLFYKNPVLRGDDWFICFDDDDPPELVVKRVKGSDIQARAKEIVEKLGICEIVSRRMTGARLFGGRRFIPASAFLLRLDKPIPKPVGMTGTLKTKGSCVRYDP